MANTRAQKTAQNLSTLTTAGDIAYATAAGTPARLGIGSSAQILTVASGIPSWATPAAASFVGCSLTNSADISIANATQVKLTWNTENYDTNGFHAASSGDVIIPSGYAGKYLITGTVTFDANTTGQRIVSFKKGSTLFSGYQDSAGVAGGVPKQTTFSEVLNLAVADSLSIEVYQSSGGALLTLFTGGYVSNWQVSYLGA